MSSEANCKNSTTTFIDEHRCAVKVSVEGGRFWTELNATERFPPPQLGQSRVVAKRDHLGVVDGSERLRTAVVIGGLYPLLKLAIVYACSTFATALPWRS